MLLHPPLDPLEFADRKALAQAVWSTVAAGAAELRQNRPARPLATVPPGAGAIGTHAPSLSRPFHPIRSRSAAN